MKKILIILILFLHYSAICQNTEWFNGYPSKVDGSITISVIAEADQLALTTTTVSGIPVGRARVLFGEAGGSCLSIPTLTSYYKNTAPMTWNATTTTIWNYTSDFSPGVMYTAIGYIITPIDTIWGNSICFTTASPTVVATVSTNTVTSITTAAASVNCEITNDGGSTITDYGVYYRRSDVGTYTQVLNSGTATTYTINLTGLSPNSDYYVYSFATNGSGTAYGNTLTFTTDAMTGTPPTVTTTSPITGITSTSGIGGGTVTSEGTDPVTVRGVCVSTYANPTISGYRTYDGSGLGSFTSTITGFTGLSPNTTYHVRAYATNVNGTSYGADITFTTSAAIPPTVSTNSVTSITTNSAISGGNITSEGSYSVTEKGVVYSTSVNPDYYSSSKTNNGTGLGTYPSTMIGLASGTTYYVRAYAKSYAGISYGSQISFMTNSATTIPTLSTISAASITDSSASSGGNITSDGGASVTARGVCWNTTGSPTISGSHTTDGGGIGSFSSSMTGLTFGTTYYARAYATNSVGITYGNQISFTTLSCPSVGDSYGGGIIVYVYQSGDPGYVSGECHGIIAASVDQSSGIWWGCYGTSISGTVGTIGYSTQNTDAIVTQCADTYAAWVCSSLSRNGYSDWQLPSTGDLSEMLLFDISTGVLGLVESSFYWSSTQDPSSPTIAAYIYRKVSGVVNSTVDYKNVNHRVRAIRYF